MAVRPAPRMPFLPLQPLGLRALPAHPCLLCLCLYFLGFSPSVWRFHLPLSHSHKGHLSLDSGIT